jgi:hypothetical protein
MNPVKLFRFAVLFVLVASLPALAAPKAGRKGARAKRPTPAAKQAPAEAAAPAADPLKNAIAEVPAETAKAAAADPTDAPTAAPALTPAAAPSPAAASPAVPSATAVIPVADPKSTKPWRGSQLSYGHVATALSLRKDAEPFYNPYYAHHLSLAPEWHFTDKFFARALFDLEQELTLADDTEYKNEVVWSDLRVDLATTGYKEERTGINISGSLRLVGGLSKVARAQTRIFSVGPGVTLARSFEVRSGLKLSYSGRFTQRFNRFTTVQFDAPTLVRCGDADACEALASSGTRNVQNDLLHGPSITFDPTEKLHLMANYQVSHGFLYPLTATERESNRLDASTDVSVRESSRFIVEASYDLLKALSLTLGVDTLTRQPGPDGLRQTPFFNRFTTVYLDLGLDVETLLSRI